MSRLSLDELKRYSRHLLLPEIGAEGQKKLKAARVLVAGAGGLGCPVAIYLAAAGVGTIAVADFDYVDASNLQRQILYTTDDIGEPKARVAVDRLRALNENIEVIPLKKQLSAEGLVELISQYDLVVDGTDNFGTRYMLNDACVIAGKPYVYGSIYRFDGQASVFTKEHGCYRCLFPQPPAASEIPNCAEAGVLGVLPAVIGSIQATEAIKLIIGIGDPLLGRLLLYDALGMRFDELKAKKNKDCAVCGDNPTIKSVSDITVACETEQMSEDNITINVDELETKLKNDAGRFTLLDVRGPEEFVICNLPGAVLIPLPELESRLGELNKQQEVVAYCRSGVRSRTAAELLRMKGFRARTLTGGINEWAKKKDPSMPVY